MSAGPVASIAGGAKIAAVLIAIAPWLAALVGIAQTFGLMDGLESSPIQRLAYWGLMAMAFASAFLISRHLWRGVHDGGSAPVRLLLLSTLPFWLLSEAAGQFLAQYMLRNGNPWGYAEASMLRIAGEFIAWGLTGSVVFGLAISAFLWRAPARRLPGIAWAWASLAPMALCVAWIVGTAQVQSPELRASLVGYAWVSLPFVLGFAGAALGDAPRAHPRPDWLLGIGLGTLIVFVSAASMATGYALIETQGAQGGYGEASGSADAVARAGRVAWLGLPLAALPLFGFATRLQRWPSPAGWSVALLPLAFLALALLIDAGGPGAEHGLAEAYPRRLWLLVAYAMLVPVALIALRRLSQERNILREGLALATALTGLMWLAWRPGLLLLAPPGSQVADAPLESDVTAPPLAAVGAPPPPPPPPPPAPKLIAPLHETGQPIEGGMVGGEANGMAGAEAGLAAEPPPAVDTSPAPVPTELIVMPSALEAMRTSGAEVQPPASLYTDRPRTTLTLVLHVDAGGRVARVEILKSSGNPELDANVRSTVETWRYRPWMHQGRAVPVSTGMTFNFVGRP
jgi:protein TonB